MQETQHTDQDDVESCTMVVEGVAQYGMLLLLSLDYP